jgi:hypothetical protein
MKNEDCCGLSEFVLGISSIRFKFPYVQILEYTSENTVDLQELDDFHPFSSSHIVFWFFLKDFQKAEYNGSGSWGIPTEKEEI